MVFAFLSFFVGFVLLLLIFFMVRNSEKDKKLNIYFLLIIAFAGAQRLLQGVETFELIPSFKNPFVGNFSFLFFGFVIGYLFFVNLLHKNPRFNQIIQHLIFPISFAMARKLFHLDYWLIKLVFFFFSSFYIALVTGLVREFFYKRKNYKELLHFQSIKNWTSITFGFFIFTYVLSNYVSLSNPQETVHGMFVQFYGLTSFLWLFAILYFFKKPVILYGEQLLIKNLNLIRVEELGVWRNTKLEPTAQEDLEVEKKVRKKVDELIFAIKKFEEELLLDFQALPTLKELAFRLDCPQSHLKYVFNYYSFCSYSEYQNNLKIKLALKLIKSGFLDTWTIDSLSTRCLFANRRTFYRNFKKLIGYTPMEYQAQLNALTR